MQRVPCGHSCSRGALYRMRRSKLLPAGSFRGPDRNVFPGANDGTDIPVSRAYRGSYNGTYCGSYSSAHCSAYGGSYCSTYGSSYNGSYCGSHCNTAGGSHCHTSGDSGRPRTEPGSISFL